MFKKLEDLGVFRNPLETALLSEYMPWIYTNVLDQLLIEQNVTNNFDGN